MTVVAPASTPSSGLPPPALGCARLTHLGVIRALGEDAAKFLQGQLTQDVVLMKPGETRLAGFCNAKGRLLASFQVFKRSADELLLVTSADTLPATLKKLSMFVMRAKLKLSDATADFSLIGQLGETPTLIAASQDAVPTSAQNDAQSAALRLALMPAGGMARTLWLLPAGAETPANCAPIQEPDWLRAEVQAGVARITQPVVEAFVPQMLNYESVAGINFKKGCYPGQEVVARSQFRGAIKRRAFVATADGPAQVGQEVFDASAPDQPVGVIAQAAPGVSSGSVVIASIQLASKDADLRVGAADGPALSGVHLPYPLLEDI